MLDPECSRIEQGDGHGAVRGREAVEASLLEPLNLLGRDVRAPGCLVDRQLPVQASVGERRLVGGDDCFERTGVLHLDVLVSA